MGGEFGQGVPSWPAASIRSTSRCISSVIVMVLRDGAQNRGNRHRRSAPCGEELAATVPKPLAGRLTARPRSIAKGIVRRGP